MITFSRNLYYLLQVNIPASNHLEWDFIQSSMSQSSPFQTTVLNILRRAQKKLSFTVPSGHHANTSYFYNVMFITSYYPDNIPNTASISSSIVFKFNHGCRTLTCDWTRAPSLLALHYISGVIHLSNHSGAFGGHPGS